MKKRKCKTCGTSLDGHPADRIYCSRECGHAEARLSAEQRFKKNSYPQDNGCILYGRAGEIGAHVSIRLDDGSFQVASRYAWERVNGKIPKALVIRHVCDAPNCVNVEHLCTGTVQDNRDDRSFIEMLDETGYLTSKIQQRLNPEFLSRVRMEYRRTAQTYSQVAEKFKLPEPILHAILDFG